MALFLRPVNRSNKNSLTDQKAQLFKEWRNEYDFARDFQVMPHGIYLSNLGNPSPEIQESSRATILDEIQRCEKLGIKLYTFHPGSTVGKTTVEESILLIASGINRTLSLTSSVTILLENMCGQGNTLGGSFQELRGIIDRVEDKDRIGVCLDTCHLFVYGHDIRTELGFRSVLNDFDSIVGLGYLKGMHLNDSKGPLGSKKDRHESIGKGFIGLDCFKFIMNNTEFDNIPLILETPLSNAETHASEIKLLYSLVDQ